MESALAAALYPKILLSPSSSTFHCFSDTLSNNMPLAMVTEEKEVIMDSFVNSCSSIEFSPCVINSLLIGKFQSKWSIWQSQIFMDKTKTIIQSLVRKYVHDCPLLAGIAWKDREHLANRNYRLYLQFHLAVFMACEDGSQQIEWALEPFAPVGKLLKTHNKCSIM